MKQFQFSKTQTKFLLDRGACQEQLRRLAHMLPVIDVVFHRFHSATLSRPTLEKTAEVVDELSALLRASDDYSRHARALIASGGRLVTAPVVEYGEVMLAVSNDVISIPDVLSMLDAILAAARMALADLGECREGRPGGRGVFAVGLIHEALAAGWYERADGQEAPKKHWDKLLRPSVETCFNVVGVDASIEWSLKLYGQNRRARQTALDAFFAQHHPWRDQRPGGEGT